MRRSRVFAITLLFAAACAVHRARQPADVSGFLDDYSLLRPGGPGEVALVYRNPEVHWTSYDKVLLEPVTLWRSGRQSLDAVPEGDLLRLVADLEGAIRRRLGDGFELVDQAQSGVMRIRLAITEARASDPILDVLRARGDGDVTPAPTGSWRRASTGGAARAPSRSTRGRMSTARSISGPTGCAGASRPAPGDTDRAE